MPHASSLAPQPTDLVPGREHAALDAGFQAVEADFQSPEPSRTPVHAGETSGHGRKLKRIIGAAALATTLFGAHATIAEASTYTVHSGDTLSQIADQHHLSLQQVLAQNPEQKITPNSIQPGEKLALGRKAKTPARYVVKSGDSLSVIAAAHDMSLSHVLKLNPKFQEAPSLIHPGQKVVLKNPSHSKHVAATEHAAPAAVSPAKTIEKQPSSPAPANLTAFARELGKIASAGSQKAAVQKPQPAVNKPAEQSPAKQKAPKHYTVDEFMGAIVAQESAGNHAAVNQHTHARGYTQIMPDSWREWSAQALGKVKKQTAEREVKVSRYKMEQYHREFGSWNSVAMAWFAGEAAAKQYRAGDKSVLTRSDGHWTVQQYIAHMQANLGKADPYKLIPELKNLKSKSQKKHHKKPVSEARTKKPVRPDSFLDIWKKLKTGNMLKFTPVAYVTKHTPGSVVSLQRNQKPEIKTVSHIHHASKDWRIEKDSRKKLGPNETTLLVRDGRNGIRISSELAPKVAKMIDDAQKDGADLDAASSLRTKSEQMTLRKQNCPDPINSLPQDCSPATAFPGTSNHEGGKAIDFKVLGRHYKRAAAWLKKHAANYGFYARIKGEPWHYSPSGH